MKPRTMRRLERALAAAAVVAAVGMVVTLHRIAQLERHPPMPPPWVRMELIYGSPGRYFIDVKLGPWYRTHHACLRALQPDGYETLGRQTTYRQWQCVRIFGAKQ